MSLVARDVSIRFGGTIAVNAVSLEVRPGEIVGLIGPNGAGKTTFINCVSGAARPTSGDIAWNGASLVGRPPHDIVALGVARTFQNVASLHDLTVLDIVKLGDSMKARRDAATTGRRRDERLIETVLRPLKLVDYAQSLIQTLPYGLRKAVDLARALAIEPMLLLLDEPVAGLTAHEARAMAEEIRRARSRFSCAIVMVEHKMDVVNATCDRLIVMAAGAKIFSGSPEEAQSDAEVRRVYLGDA